jgi:AraC-like DNA-binding protein
VVSRPAPKEGGDFASAPLVALVAQALRARAPELVPAELGRLDAVRQAHSPLALERDLLQLAYDRLGSRFVFEIGRGIDQVPFSPLLESFLRSEGGDVLLEKWRRFERYGHGRHRTRVERHGAGHYVLDHHAISAPQPGPAHDLFVLGVLVSFLGAIGTQGLYVSLLPGDRCLVRDDIWLATTDSDLRGPTDRWRIHWRTEPAAPGRTSARSWPSAEPREATKRIRELLLEDPSRGWSLTEIGYLCGFSDAAHFSRDFRSSIGTSPSEFRAVVARGVQPC